MVGLDFLGVLGRLIGGQETARCLAKICRPAAIDQKFHNDITNYEALALYVYSTANGWHSYINQQLWSGAPSIEVVQFAEVLNGALGKLVPIAGKSASIYRGYETTNIADFSARYVEGGNVTFPGFTSASFSEAGAFGGNVLFIIRALSARSIWWLSPNFHEEEALLPTDCNFRVVDKQSQSRGNTTKLVIVLQELNQRP